MAPVIATTVIKDGAGTNITGGVQTLDLSGAGTGPFSFINALVDGATGTTLATVKKASVTAVATDPALVVGLNPLSNQVSQTGTWTAIVSGTTFISGGTNITAVVSGTTFISGGTLTAVLTSTVISGGVVTASLNQAGAAVSSTNALFSNLTQNNATLTPTNGIWGNVMFNNAIVSASVGLPSTLISGATTVAVKGANLSAVASDAALVVALSPNNINLNGQTTMANSAPVVIANDQSRIAVSPPLTISTTATPTLSTTTAYTATQVIGGILTFTAVLGTTTSGIIQSITCKLNTGLHTVGLSVALFKASATAGTYTDHVAIAINTADVPNFLGSYRLSTALSDVGNMAIYNLDGIGKAFAGGTSNLYGVVTALGTTLGLGNVTAFSIELAVLPG